MRRKLTHAVALAWLFGLNAILLEFPASADSLAAREVLTVLEMNDDQITEVAEGVPVVYALGETSDEEIAAGIAWFFPVPLGKAVAYLRHENPALLDIDIIASGFLTQYDESDSLAAILLPEEETGALLDVEPGNEFNLSISEIASFRSLKEMLPQMPRHVIHDKVLQHYREILFRRFQSYRRGGTNAIEPYAREQNQNSKPSLQLRRAAEENIILKRHFPALYEAWLEYPTPLPDGTDEDFSWVEKKVKGRPAVILRHRVRFEWNDGLLVLLREFYAPHSYNSSQWITGSVAYRGGTIVFQQVRSHTDQVAGLASSVKHMIGRQLLKGKMLMAFKRLCRVLEQCS